MQEMRRVLRPGGCVAISVNQALENNVVYEAPGSAIARRLATTAVTIASPFSLRDADELRAPLQTAGFQHVVITPVTFTVRFPEPARFVQLTVLSSAAVLSVFAQMDPAARSELVDAVALDMQSTLEPHFDGDAVAFALKIHIGLGHV